jgi:hypothetical protein
MILILCALFVSSILAFVGLGQVVHRGDGPGEATMIPLSIFVFLCGYDIVEDRLVHRFAMITFKVCIPIGSDTDSGLDRTLATNSFGHLIRNVSDTLPQRPTRSAWWSYCSSPGRGFRVGTFDNILLRSARVACFARLSK